MFFFIRGQTKVAAISVKNCAESVMHMKKKIDQKQTTVILTFIFSNYVLQITKLLNKRESFWLFPFSVSFFFFLPLIHSLTRLISVLIFCMNCCFFVVVVVDVNLQPGHNFIRGYNVHILFSFFFFFQFKKCTGKKHLNRFSSHDSVVLFQIVEKEKKWKKSDELEGDI